MCHLTPRTSPDGTARLLLAAGASDANAQQVYRNVGTDGKVTFSDQPPAPTPGGHATRRRHAGAPAAATRGLPYRTAAVAQRYPGHACTPATDCSPCGAGRSMLISARRSFDEKTVTSNEDVEALSA